jgi:hypothetical protein
MALVSLRRIFGLMLAAVVGFAPLAPPEHVHEAEEHGLHHLLVHRHAEQHGTVPHSREHRFVLDDDDAPVLTLAAVFTIPATPDHLHGFAGELLRAIEALTPGDIPPSADYERPVIHGPPRGPTSLRAPPSLPAI